MRDLLRQVRSAARLTQLELSEKLGRPQSYVSDYERGHRRLDWVAVDEVISACGYSLSKFAAEYLAATSGTAVDGAGPIRKRSRRLK